MTPSRARPTGASLVATVSLVLAIAASAGAAPGAAHAATDLSDWFEVRTERFTLYGNTSPDVLRTFVVELERLRELLSRTTVGFRVDGDVPTRIYAFRDDRELAPFRRTPAGRQANVSGYLLERPYLNYVVFDASAGGSPTRVALHEYVHHVLHATFDRIPVWLDEGLAEFYSTFESHDAGRRADVGRPIEAHVEFLEDRGLLPVDELFATTRASKTYNEGLRQGQFYAQSWLMTHWLMADPERRAALGRYLAAIDHGTDPELAWAEHVDIPLDRVDDALEAHLESGSTYGSSYRFEVVLDASRAEVRPVPPGEVLAHLGTLLAERGGVNAREARPLLRGALERGGPEHLAASAMGLTFEHDGLYGNAATWYRRAAGSDTADAIAHARLGAFLLRLAIRRDPTLAAESDPPDDVLEARRHLERALESAPDHPEILSAYGKSFLIGTDDPCPGIDALERAYRLRPMRIDVQHDLIALLADAGRTERGFEILERDLHRLGRDFPATVRSAESRLVAAEVDRARDRLVDDDAEGAVDVLDAALARVRSPTVRYTLEQRRNAFVAAYRVAAGLAPSAPTETAPPRADRTADDVTTSAERFRVLQEVATLVNVGRAPEAEALLEATVAACTDLDTCAPVVRELEKVRAAVERDRVAARIDRAAAFANDGRVDEALVLLERERSACDPARTAEACALLEERLAAMREVARYNRLVARYNEAVDLLREGKRREARAILLAVAAEGPGGQLDQLVRTALRQISRR